MSLPGEFKFRHIDAQIVIGEKVRQELDLQPTRFIRQGCRTFLIPNGIDESVFSYSHTDRKRIRTQLGIPPSNTVIISTSRLHAQKGVAHAINAFSLAVKATPTLKMLILGDGPEAESLKAQVARLDISSSVYFIGPVGREKIKAYLSAADVFLFTTTRVEGLPLNLLEALSAGLPCIASHHISEPEFDIIAVDPREPLVVAQAIGRSISETGRSRSSKLPAKFTLEHAVDEYLSVLNSLRIPS
jgi:glycosyltransferase involved in cell wall biosynthesis